MKQEKISIPSVGRNIDCIVLRPQSASEKLPGILWIHGGGYALGMAGMVHMSCGKLLAEKFGAVVMSPDYRLSKEAPYPAAFEDCCAALDWLWDRAEEFGVDRKRIVVGGESAGGGLAAAVCLYARDRGRVKIAMQIPLYPMIDCNETASSRDNHGRVWNTKRNRWGWRLYLGERYGTDDVPPYASAAHAKNYRGLPPCYTFVSAGEPFYTETLDYTENLRRAGVRAECDVYPGNVHAFDMLCPWCKTSRDAKRKLCTVYEEWIGKA